MDGPTFNNSIRTLESKEIVKLAISDNFICLRSLTSKRIRFEIEYGLERGSSANSFLITSSLSNVGNKSKSILIHPPGISYGEVFVSKLLELLPINDQELKIVIGHINPNRINMLKKLASFYPNIKLLCSTPGAKILTQIWNQEKSSSLNNLESIKSSNARLPELQIIQQKETININDQYVIELIPAPTARWPGGLLAFEVSSGLLMSDKFFGAHLYTKTWAEANRVSTEEDRRYYFDCLMTSITSQIESLIEKLQDLDIRTIAPGHGPAIEASWRSLFNDYRQWSESDNHISLKVVMIFASAYGNTATIADALSNGISKTGVQVQSINCEFSSTTELIQAIRSSDAYLIGTPTIGGHAPTPIVTALGTLLSEGDTNKFIGIFGSYGWSGEALELLENKLSDAGFKFGFEAIKIKFTPSSSTIKQLEETGTLFGRKIIKEHQRVKRRLAGGMISSRSDSTMLALGRVVGTLCVLTTSKSTEGKTIRSGMVASWVSQASFMPPGISIAVAKDRAVEILLHKGDRFILNILTKGKESSMLKQFLQPFSPGEDRLSGIETIESPAGQPILPSCLAWLEGIVKERMECGDHWLLYTEIQHGKIIDNKGTTAVHHRRSGANY